MKGKDVKIRYLKAVMLIGLALVVNLLLTWKAIENYRQWKLEHPDFASKIIYSDPFDYLIAFDLEKNGADDLMGIIAEKCDTRGLKQIKFFSPFSNATNVVLNYYLHLQVPLNDKEFMPIDIDEDSKPEIPFLRIKDQRISLLLHGMEGQNKVLFEQELEALSIPLPGDNLLLEIVDITDLDGDGKIEILWRINGDFMGLPRGYACHDPFTGKKKWEFLSGAIPFQNMIIDIDRDGKKELIFSLKAPHNGVTYNGMNDDTSYVGVLDCCGRLRWIRNAGGFFSWIQFNIGDVDSDGKYEIVTSRSCHRAIDPDVGEIKIYDLLSGKELKWFVDNDVTFSGVFLANINETPQLEIVVGDTGGNIRIFDHELNLLKRVKTGSVVYVLGVDGFPGDDLLIFTFNQNSQFSLFNCELKRLFSFMIMDDALYIKPIIPVNNGKEKYFIWNADKPYFISKRVWGIGKYASLFTSNFSLFVFLIISFNLLLFLFFRERAARKRAGIKKTNQLAGDEWTGMALDLLHRMKTPLTGILWETEKMKSSLEQAGENFPAIDQIKQIPETILGDINELKVMNRFLMRFLQPQSYLFRDIDPNAVLSALIDKYARFLGGKIEFVSQLAPKLPLVSLDEDQVNEALGNIIENAIDAMPHGGKIEIASSLTQFELEGKKQKEVLVEIIDNGPGIPAEQLKEIFKPHFTTKTEGFGIGLTIAKRVIDAHGGRIDVESQPGIGSKFAIYLPEKNQ